MVLSSQVDDAVKALPLIAHGGNIRLTIRASGTYRFELKPTGDGGAAFTLSKVSGNRG